MQRALDLLEVDSKERDALHIVAAFRTEGILRLFGKGVEDK